MTRYRVVSPFVAPAGPRPWRRAIQIAAILAFSIVFSIAFGDACVAWRSRPYLYDDAVDLPVEAHPDTAWAIVPAAPVKDDDTPSTALADRLDAALALYQDHRVGHILVSGDGIHDEDGVMERYLVERGVPKTAIEHDGLGTRTRWTMYGASQLGIKRAVVCSQQYHLARAVMWARHYGIDAVGLSADWRWSDHQVHQHIREVFARAYSLVELAQDSL